MSVISKQVILVNRPVGELKVSDFNVIETTLPELQDGEVLLKTLYFSLDPYMRRRMNTTKGSYIECFKLNVPLDGAAISIVEESKSSELNVGDIVLNATGWQTYAIFKGKAIQGMAMTSDALTKLPKDVKPSLYLGALGMPGLSAHYGLLGIAMPKPGETVVVSAATGAVGAMVGQIAKLKGCRVVGIAGGSEKCQYAVRELGYDACVDYKGKSFRDELRKACPNKIDVYFESVGGEVFKAVLPLLNNFARVPVCGMISYYNDGSTLQEPGFNLSNIFPKLKAFIHMYFHLDQTPLIFSSMLGKRIKYQGFIIRDHFDGYAAFIDEMIPYIQSGKIKTKEDIVKGIENSPAAFIRLLQGKNFGKLVVEI
jgi:NADPH-dependent curcumin reductase CurA